MHFLLLTRELSNQTDEYLNTWVESATEARAVNAPSWTIRFPFYKGEKYEPLTVKLNKYDRLENAICQSNYLQ